MSIKMGCQLYTWQMSYDRHAGRLDHIAEVIKQAKFQGMEPELCMLGKYYDQPVRLAEKLKDTGLELGALTLALPWRQPEETEEERKEADHVLNYLRHFPDTILIVVQLPYENREHVRERQRNALSCIRAVSERAAERGIRTAFHPNSPAGSVFRTEEDYKVMFEGLDSRTVGYAPDTGHIANGGMDPLQVIKEHRSLIRHVHFKDIDSQGQWTAMGKGIIDHPRIVRLLKESGYEGWIMVEEESKKAEELPDEVTEQNGRYVERHLTPLIG